MVDIMQLAKEGNLDEMCKCKHLRSQHRPFDSVLSDFNGHGPCDICGCEKFTWVSWTDKEGNLID